MRFRPKYLFLISSFLGSFCCFVSAARQPSHGRPDYQNLWDNSPAERALQEDILRSCSSIKCMYVDEIIHEVIFSIFIFLLFYSIYRKFLFQQLVVTRITGNNTCHSNEILKLLLKLLSRLEETGGHDSLDRIQIFGQIWIRLFYSLGLVTATEKFWTLKILFWWALVIATFCAIKFFAALE